MTGGKVEEEVFGGCGIDIPVDRLLKQAVKYAVSTRKRGKPAWAGVSVVFALGSTYSAQLCRRFGLDPDEVRK
jgi:hypothetical protein